MYICKPEEDVCLILTQSFQPFGITSAREGFKKLMRGGSGKKNKIKAIDLNGNMNSFNEWIVNEFLFDNQPHIRSIDNSFPVPTVLVTNSLYFYRPRNIKRINIKTLYVHFDGRCQICNNKKPMNEMSIEHIKPKSKGGTHTPDNLTLTCRRCNCKKTDVFPYLTKDGKELTPISEVEYKMKIKRPEWKFFIKT